MPSSESIRRLRPIWLLPAVLGTVILASDQVSKIIVRRLLDADRTIDVIAGCVQFVLVHNPGAAFGMFSDHDVSYRRVLLVALSIVALGILAWLLRGLRREDTLGRTAVGVLAGGAAGNLIDRIAFGHVTDFIRVYYQSWEWPTFNIADSAITIGIGLLLADSLIFSPRRHRLPGAVPPASEGTVNNAP